MIFELMQFLFVDFSAADDLVGIFAWLLVRANIPHMQSEAALLSDFMDDFSGEPAYCLTTLQVALGYLAQAANDAFVKK